MAWHDWVCGEDLQVGEKQCCLFRCVCQFLLIRSLALDPVFWSSPLFYPSSGAEIKETTQNDWYKVDFFPLLPELIEGFAMTQMNIDS